MSSAALDKLRRELRKLLRCSRADGGVGERRLGRRGCSATNQVDSVCVCSLGGRIADVTPTLAKLARDPEQGSAASQLCAWCCLSRATWKCSLHPPTAGRAPETLVLPLRTATFAEAAMARAG